MADDTRGGFAEIARALRAATVRVHDANRRGYGSGIVWHADGSIVTNAHVVRGDALVEWADGRTAHARLIARDERYDLALLRVRDARDLAVATIRAAATVVPGELAVAVGNPHGLHGVVSAGIVHRRNSRWVIADVRLAPGNSGGPLADAWGRVIGVNAMVARGLALAIPSDVALAFTRAA